MNSFIVFNHYSLPCSSKEEADYKISDFIHIAIKVCNYGILTILVDEYVDKKWYRLELSEGYYFRDYFQKNKKNEKDVYLSAFLEIATRQDLPRLDECRNTPLESFDVKFDNKHSSVFKAAVYYDSYIISFSTNGWAIPKIQVDVETLDGNSEIISSKRDIINIYERDQINEIEPDLIDKRNDSVKSWEDIRINKEKYFPHIGFLNNTLVNPDRCTNNGNTFFNQAKASFTVLNKFCERWQDGIYENYAHEYLRECGLNHGVSGESESVKNNEKLRGKRMFRLPSGKKEYFENHIKINSYRIYFYPDARDKKIYIGHIGDHLPLD